MADVTAIATQARAAARAAQALTRESRDAALRAVREELRSRQSEILAANEADVSRAEDGPLLKRLKLGGRKYEDLLKGVEAVEKLDDPVGKVTLARELDEGLELRRVTCPIGVIAIIFESRPEAAVQISSLAIKSANAVILKGGKEAEASNAALVSAIRAGLGTAGLPENMVQSVSTRGEIAELLKLDSLIDLVIPRGSNALVRYITDNTRIPVLGHADGICSIYVDASADLERAVALVLDSKTQYPAVCNAAEQLLIHTSAAPTHLPAIARALLSAGVTLHVDAAARAALSDVGVGEGGSGRVVDVSDGDGGGVFEREFLGLEMGVQVVGGVGEAVVEINRCGSHHTDMIVAEDGAVAEEFMGGVDSAGVFHNASTRFADGFRYGFGAEVGVSTTRTHSRGPVGMEGLLIYKYRLVGSGHTVAPYASGDRVFTHRDLPLAHD